MGFLGKIKVALGILKDNGGVFTRRFQIDPGGGACVSVSQFGTAGDDSAPLDTDRAILTQLPRSGSMAIIGYIDTKNAPAVAKGERKLYARDVNGNIKASMWLKANGGVVVDCYGEISLSNTSGSIVVAENGVITLNGVTIGIDGAITTPSTIHGAGVTDTTTNVTLGTHKHPGTNTPPTPGT